MPSPIGGLGFKLTPGVVSLNGLEQPLELPLMWPLSGAKPPPRWQPPETGFDPQHMQCLRFTWRARGGNWD
jgi:hypothetical protein